MKYRTIAAAALAAAALTGCSTTETVTVTEVPQSCLDTIDLLHDMISGPIADSSQEQLTLIDLVNDAMYANFSDGSSYAVADGLNEFSERISAHTERFNEMADELAVVEGECWGAAS